jgi:hypothetical protein
VISILSAVIETGSLAKNSPAQKTEVRAIPHVRFGADQP